MNDLENAEFGLTNIGEDDVQKVPVEVRDPAKIENSIVVGNDKQETVVEVPAKKKRGRPSKKESRSFYCATCRETYSEEAIMKIGAGEERYAAFCNICQKSLGFIDQVVQDKVARLIKHNPVKF